MMRKCGHDEVTHWGPGGSCVVCWCGGCGRSRLLSLLLRWL
jgi:hypothetical protein